MVLLGYLLELEKVFLDLNILNVVVGLIISNLVCGTINDVKL